jgi:hypothetical protein
MPSFMNRNGSFFDYDGNASTRVVAPLTGTTVAMTGQDDDLYINPAGTLAALTVTMPAGPMPGDVHDLHFTQIITALAVKDSAGTTITTAPTSAAVGDTVTLRYVQTVGWVKWR